MSLGWSGQWRTSAMGTRTWSVNSQCSEPASLRLWLTVPVQSQHGIPKQQQKKHKKPSLPLPPHSFLWESWGAILQLCAGSDLQAGSSSLRTLYLRDAGCLGRTITELVMKQKRHFFQKGNATALLNCLKKKKIEEEHQVRLGAAVQSMVLTCKLSKQKRVWMETWYQRSWIFFDFWELLLICVWIQVQRWVIPSAPLPPVTFQAASFFPAMRYSRASLCSPQAVKTACDFLGKRRMCSVCWALMAILLGEAAQGKVWERWSISGATHTDRSHWRGDWETFVC